MSDREDQLQKKLDRSPTKPCKCGRRIFKMYRSCFVCELKERNSRLAKLVKP